MQDAMFSQAANITVPEFFLALYREKVGWYEERMRLEKEVMEEKLGKAEVEKRAEVEKSKAEMEKRAAVAEVKLKVATTEVLRLRGQLHMRGLMGKKGCCEHVKS